MAKRILKKQGTIGILILLCLSVIFTIIDKESIFDTLSKEISGKVIKIYDGDTITLLHDNKRLKIRLYGIDAPESNQNYGRESQENLLNLCPLDSQATLKIKDKDKYGRIVAIVLCNDINVNAEQVKNGYAWAYREYSNAYTHLEIKARVEKKGLWRQKNPVKPSEFRKNLIRDKVL
ncbi:thermonuclease family protein [Helicobacter sp. MIT 03-1614]|nr:thermonuclease family protein [Helicobacter sp. MIT 03-1614]TLD89884.1 thermonuclease family protein [Helicobacter sp. MIT 03-1616]